MEKIFKKPKIPFFWFQLFKYAVYLAVFTNVILFFIKESNAVYHKFTNGLSLAELINAYTSTIDTASWVILIFMFELETYILSEKQLEGKIKWILRVLRTLCYGFILYAFTGYWNNFQWIMDFSATKTFDLCQFQGQSWLIEVDQFKAIDTTNCASLSDGTTLLKKSDKTIYTNTVGLNRAIKLALTDILNAGSWILVVLVLEIDIWLQRKNKFAGKVYVFCKYFKFILYLVLIGSAVYWGRQGTFLDFWDAFLWILAFFFIENNLFGWQANSENFFSY